MPLLMMHGGWGYEIYRCDRQVEAFSNNFRILVPDRSGYGRSPKIDTLQDRFHNTAAVEMTRFLDALDIEKAVLWGHSDGAVIAAIMGLSTPERFPGIIMEAFHYDRNKPASREFFQTMVDDPDSFGSRVCGILASDHGDSYWRKVLEMGGRAWLKIAEESNDPSKDFYGGRLSELSVPAIFLHGKKDPRTEPGELDAVQSELPHVPIRLIDEGGHSPHSESAAVKQCNQIAGEFLRTLLR